MPNFLPNCPRPIQFCCCCIFLKTNLVNSCVTIYHLLPPTIVLSPQYLSWPSTFTKEEKDGRKKKNSSIFLNCQVMLMAQAYLQFIILCLNFLSFVKKGNSDNQISVSTTDVIQASIDTFVYFIAQEIQWHMNFIRN